ncbi:MAG TPA: hypothetical protein VGH38_24610 [Bryobacteraceae bacterium]|jgi:hypothetical protein
MLAASTTKKAVIHRFEKEPVVGHVNPVSYLQPTGVELLSAQGNAATVPYIDIKSISFVRDFDDKTEAPRRVFNTRPKMEGLWVRFEFRDGEVLEGVMTNNLLQVEHYGFTVIPPDSSSSQQRIFVPRVALRSVAVLGVIGSPLKKKKTKPAPKEQIGLFEE